MLIAQERTRLEQEREALRQAVENIDRLASDPKVRKVVVSHAARELLATMSGCRVNHAMPSADYPYCPECGAEWSAALLSPVPQPPKEPNA